MSLISLRENRLPGVFFSGSVVTHSAGGPGARSDHKFLKSGFRFDQKTVDCINSKSVFNRSRYKVEQHG